MFLLQTCNWWFLMLILMCCEENCVTSEKSNLQDVQIPFEIETFICSSDKLIVQGSIVKISSVFTAECFGKVKFIEIFALNNLIIDADFNVTGQQVQLSLIAPVWEVIDNRKIILNGKDGDNHESPYAPNGIGSFRNGQPGKPGGSAGKFVGIAHNIIHESNLEIHMNGGSGGSGQHGGKGINGVNGEDPPIPENSFEAASLWESLQFAYNITRDFNSTHEDVDLTINYISIQVFAKNATKPGDGGHGGAGGHGGYAGTHLILVLEGRREISILANKGNNGVAGKGGLPGAVSQSEVIEVFFINKYKKSTGELLSKGKPSPLSIDSLKSIGLNGIDGHNHEESEKPDAVDLINPSHVINNYKSFVRRSVVMDGLKPNMDFVEAIEQNEHIQSLYKTLGYVDEMRWIETQYIELKKKISLTPYYESLLKRTEIFSRNFTEPIENKAVLTWLYTAITMRMSTVSPTPIVDLSQCLAVIEATILKIRRNEIEANVEDQQNFMNSKIRSIATFIKVQILPEFENIFAEISSHVSTLIDELFDRQYKFTPPEEPKNDKEGGFFWIGAENEVRSISSNCRDQFSVDLISEFTEPTLDIGGRREKYLLLIEKLNDVEDELYEFSKVESESVSLINLIANVTDFKYYLTEQLLNRLSDPNEVNRKRDELISVFELKKSELQDFSPFFDAILTILNPRGVLIEKKTEEITYQTDDDAAAQANLDNIYDTILEQFLKMERTVRKISHQPIHQPIPTRSDESKWQIIETIRDVKAFFRKLSNETAVMELLCRSIEKLDDTIIFLYEAYDHIDHLNEAKSVNEFMNNNSLKLQRSADSTLTVAARSLENMIQTNKIVEKYESALKVFEKQHFPFGNKILLSDLKLPTDLQPKDNEKLAKVVIDHFYHLKEKVESIAELIGEYDRFVLRDIEFSSGQNSLVGPFNKWLLEGPNEEKKKKLLRGEEIELSSSIRLANMLSAVKFSEIGIKLITNENKQVELDWELEKCIVTLTMKEKSYYRCGKEIHVFNVDDNVSFSRSFKRDSNGKPVMINDAYNKVFGDKNYYLSPYTTWKIQIESIKAAALTKFENDKISLELVGRGQYVKCRDCMSGICDKRSLFGHITDHTEH